jgi:hypothetical protein
MNEVDKRAKNLQHPPQVSTTSKCSRSLKSHLGLLRPTAVNWTGADVTTEEQQHEGPSSLVGGPPPIVLNSRVNPLQLQRQLKTHQKATLSSVTSQKRSDLSGKKWEISDSAAVNSSEIK